MRTPHALFPRSRRLVLAGLLLALALLAAPSAAFAEAPTVVSETATNIRDTSVTFEASINPQGSETSYEFQYATDEAFTENTGMVEGKEKLQEAFEELSTGPVNAAGLQPDTVYFYRVVATNSALEVSEGPVQSFITLAKPAVTVEEAEEVTRTSATVSGSVNPGGGPATYRVVYATQADYRPGAGECPEGIPCAYANGARSQTLTAVTTGYAPEQIGPVALEELTPGTVYHYTLIATNASGTTVGPDETFETQPALPPAVTLNPAGSITATTATLTGAVDTRGLQTSARFQLALKTEPGNIVQIPATITSQSGNTVQLTASLQGLQPNTTYTITLTATNHDATTQTEPPAAFTTLATPPTLTPPGTPPALAFTPLTTIATKEAQEDKQNIQRELLNKTLKTCRHKHNKHKRTTCEKHAHKKYKL